MIFGSLTKPKEQRIIVYTPFMNNKIISYGLIVYAEETNRCVILQRKHSIEFLLILSGNYRPSILILLLPSITFEEMNIIEKLLNNDKKYFEDIFINTICLEQVDLDYAYLRFMDSKDIINKYIKDTINNKTYSNLRWTWPKGRVNVDDKETYLQCAIREFKEEVEIDLPKAKYISPNYHVVESVRTMTGKIIETRCWLYVITHEIIFPPLTNHKEVNDRKWVPLDVAISLFNQPNIYKLIAQNNLYIFGWLNNDIATSNGTHFLSFTSL